MIYSVILPYVVLLLFCLYLLVKLAQMSEELLQVKEKLYTKTDDLYDKIALTRGRVEGINARLIQFITIDLLEAAIKSLVEEVQKERQTDNIL